MLFKKSFKKKFEPVLRKITEHKLFEDCVLESKDLKTFIHYFAYSSASLSDYLRKKIGVDECLYPVELFVDEVKGVDKTGGFSLTLRFTEERYEEVGLGLISADFERKYKDLITFNQWDRDKSINLSMQNVSEANFERALNMFLDEAYTIMESLN